MSIDREADVILINNLDSRKNVGEFIRALQGARHAGISSLQLDFSAVRSVFPNAAVPVGGLIERCRLDKLELHRTDHKPAVTAAHVDAPLEFADEDALKQQGVLNKIWRFDTSAKVAWLVDGFIDKLAGLDKFQAGVLLGLEWCLNEIMDNVLQHSLVGCGFIMGQIHRERKHVAFAIFDYGQGIFNSFRDSAHYPPTTLDALTLAVREGVTRDKEIGQGNGLYGLHRIVEHNNGSLNIVSGNAAYLLNKGQLETHKDISYYSHEQQCTTIEFQLDYNNPVSISDALNFNGKQYEPVNLRLESFQNDWGECNYLIRERASGFGTRLAGARARNEVLNIYREANQVINLDFEGIALISSSFADELIGKLVVEFGFFGFNNIIRLRNMSPLIQGIVQRSVSQRMAESFGREG